MFVLQTRLEEMAKTVKMQQIMDRNRANASNLLTLDNVKQMSMYQDRMQTFLAPFLHRDRQGPCSSAAKLWPVRISLRSLISSKCWNACQRVDGWQLSSLYHLYTCTGRHICAQHCYQDMEHDRNDSLDGLPRLYRHPLSCTHHPDGHSMQSRLSML